MIELSSNNFCYTYLIDVDLKPCLTSSSSSIGNFMSNDFKDLKQGFQSKIAYFNTLKSKKAKVTIVFVLVSIIAIKILTTIYTVDWLTGLMNKITN